MEAVLIRAVAYKFEFHTSAARPKGLSPELSESGMERVEPCESQA
jgi:hypothetical protein